MEGDRDIPETSNEKDGGGDGFFPIENIQK